MLIKELTCSLCKQVVGTLGYAAPDYIQTGRLTAKSDVWSYGIFLYELITGRRPFDRNRPKGEQNLLEWVRPHLSSFKKFQLILDPRLEGKYSPKSAQKLAAIANRCLIRQAKSRPRMSDVLMMVDKIVETTEIGSPPRPIIVTALNNDPALKDAKQISKREYLKRRFIKPILGENGRLARGIWRPKPVSTH